MEEQDNLQMIDNLYDPAELGNAVKTLRKAAGFTQHDLAHKLGVADHVIAHIEQGLVKTMPPKLLLKLVVIFETSIDDLVIGRRLQ